MPKLLIVNTTKNYGSTGKIAEQIGLQASSNGWDVKLVHSSRYSRESKLDNICVGTLMSERIHALKSLFFDSHGLGSVNETKKLIEKIRCYDPDLIHLHNLHGYYINYKILFEYIINHKIPVVWTMHDCWSFTGHCTYFDIVKCNKWKTECSSCPNLKGYPKSILFDRSNKNFILKKQLFTKVQSMTMVAVSDWLGNLAKQSFLEKKCIKVIHNGIDTDIFKPSNSNLRKELNLSRKFIILGVASNGFSGRKGLREFVKLSHLLSEDFQIILIGIKEAEIKEIPNNIIYKKRTANQKELVSYYSMADVFVNLTLSDNFPTTNIEALSCGTPVITYRTGGSPEAIDKHTGIVVEQGDIQAVFNAILEINSNNKIKYSLSCRDRVLRLFNKDIQYHKYIDLYNDIFKSDVLNGKE